MKMALSEVGGDIIYPCIFCKTDYDKVGDLDKHIKLCHIGHRQNVSENNNKKLKEKTRYDTDKVVINAYDKQSCILENQQIKELSWKNKRTKMARKDIRSNINNTQISIEDKIVKLEPIEHIENIAFTKVQKETVTEPNGPNTAKNMRYDWLPFYTIEDDILRCVACLLQFRGLRQTIKHLSSSSCGMGVQRQQKGIRRPLLNNLPKLPKKDYMGLYTKEGLVYVCYTCTLSFQTFTGVHGHLKRTLCGFGEEEAKKPRLDYRSLYNKDGGWLVCSTCLLKYKSHTGLHDHLRKTTCGFGTGEAEVHNKDAKYKHKSNYSENCLYRKNGNVFSCTSCGSSFNYKKAIYRHLKDHPCAKGISLCCSLCGKKFASSKELEKHLETICFTMETETKIVEAELKLKILNESGEDGNISDGHSEDDGSSRSSSSSPKEEEEIEEYKKSLVEKKEEPMVEENVEPEVGKVGKLEDSIFQQTESMETNSPLELLQAVKGKETEAQNVLNSDVFSKEVDNDKSQENNEYDPEDFDEIIDTDEDDSPCGEISMRGCIFCGKEFAFKDDLEEHLKIICTKNETRTNIGDFKFKSKSELQLEGDLETSMTEGVINQDAMIKVESSKKEIAGKLD